MTYIASTAPFKLLFQFGSPGKSSKPKDIPLDLPLLTSDGKQVIGRIDLTLSVVTQGSMFASVMPEGAHLLLQLLGLDGDVITKSDVANLINEELPPKLLAIDFDGYTADELKGNRDLLRDISGSLETELASTVDRFGLQLDDFSANWGTMPRERHQSLIRDTDEAAEKNTDFGSPVRSGLVDRQSNRNQQAYHVRTPLETPKNDNTPKHRPRVKTETPSKRLNRKPSPLYQAAENGYTDLVKALISSGADANIMTEGRFTPLHAAAMRGRTKTVQALISSGADANVKTKSGGLTPLDYATLNGHTETEQVLLSAQGYSRERLDTSHRVILITINKTYSPNMTATQLYEATRKWWVVDKRRERAKYAVAVYEGRTLEVYEIIEWYSGQYKGKTRWTFRGRMASHVIRSELRNKAVSHLRKRGNTNPILYLNC